VFERTPVRARLALAARWLVGAALLAWVASSVEWVQLAQLFSKANWWLMLPTVAAIAGTNILAGWTWWLLVRLLVNGDSTLSAGAALRVFYVAQAFGSVTPMNVGNDVYRAQVCRASHGSLRHAFAPIVVQRFTSSIVIVLLGLLAVPTLPLPSGASRVLLGLFGASLVAGIVVLLLLAARNAWILRRLGLPEITPRVLRKATIAGLALALLFHLACAGLTCVLARLLSTTVSLERVFFAVLLAQAAVLIPVSVSGLGFMEGSFALLLPLVGGTAELGLGVGLLLRMAWLLTIVVGVTFWWFGMVVKPRQARCRDEYRSYRFTVSDK